MNGAKARQLRDLAWGVLMAHGIRHGAASPAQFRRLNRRMKADYRRTGRLPVVVQGVPERAFDRRSA